MADVAPTVFVARPNPPHGDGADVATLSLIVPAYNEAKRLPALFASLRDHVDPATTEIVVVDDGSDDGTADVARRCGDWAPLLRLVVHERNLGKGAAVRSGVFASQAPIIGFVDADDATDLCALSEMVAQLDSNVAAVFGSRHAPGSTVIGSPPIRGVMGRMFNHLVRYAAGTAISDTQCGAKVFRAPAARLAFSSALVDGFAFDVEVLRRLVALGFDVVEHPVRWHYVPGTKIRPSTPFTMLRDIVRLRLRSETPTLDYVDVAANDAVFNVAEPLVAQPLTDASAVARILVPDWAAPTASEIAERLGEAGLESQMGSTDSWLTPQR